MHIGYVIPEFPGQTHSFFWREIEGLEAEGARVSLISTRRPPRRLMSHVWAEEAAARTFYLFPPTLPNGVLAAASLPRAFARALPALRGRRARERAQALGVLPFAEILRRHAAEAGIEHLHLGSCGQTALVAMLCRLLGGPSYSLTLHNPLRIFGPMQDLKWGHAAFGTVITEGLRRELEAELGPALPRTLFVQAMGVDTEKFRRAAPYEPWRPGETLRIFSCGRLNRVKGYEDLLAAVARLRDEGLTVELRIAGEDDDGGTGYRRILEAAITAHGLGEAVTLLGAVGEAQILAELEAAHLFVLASFAEPLGVVYMEAMSCGVPTIGTRAGGVPELIEDGTNGRLVPPQDSAALAAAIDDLARTPELAAKLGEAGRATVEARFRARAGAERIYAAIRAGWGER